MRVKEFLDCPVCWEPFNVVENVPYVFWCGHTLCKTCVLSVCWTQVKYPAPPIQLPFFVSCPWCQLPCFRLVWKGNLRFPRKNFFVLWLVETANGNRVLSHSSSSSSFISANSVQQSSSTSIHQTRVLLASSTEQYHQELYRGSSNTTHGRSYLVRGWRACVSLQNSVLLSVRFMAKFPLAVVFMLVVSYMIPASAAILVAYLLLTFLFALPSFLVLYFSCPVLDSLVREIIA